MEEDCNGNQGPQLPVALERERERIATVVIINFVEFIDGILFASSDIIWVKILVEFYERNCGY